MIHFALTHHAVERAKERVGWNRSTLGRMLERVFYDGLAASTPRREIRGLLLGYQTQDQSQFARAYGEHVFLFTRGQVPDEAILVTVLPLPHGLRSAAREARRLAYAS
ncbi:MAG: hypothetical protein RIQ93_1192 [Verrucomicrobiota bacterium]|jgi:hypothetical protein